MGEKKSANEHRDVHKIYEEARKKARKLENRHQGSDGEVYSITDASSSTNRWDAPWSPSAGWHNGNVGNERHVSRARKLGEYLLPLAMTTSLITGGAVVHNHLTGDESATAQSCGDLNECLEAGELVMRDVRPDEPFPEQSDETEQQPDSGAVIPDEPTKKDTKSDKEKSDRAPERNDTKKDTANELFRVATANILHSTGTGGHDWKKRLDTSLDKFNDLGLDAIGLQEVRPNQNREIRKTMKSKEYKAGEGISYRIWPTELKPSNKFSPNPVMWNNDKFKFKDGRRVEIDYFGNNTDEATYVTLENRKTGDEFGFLNTHDPKRSQDPDFKKAENNTDTYIDVINKSPNPDILVGDFNQPLGAGGRNNRYGELYSEAEMRFAGAKNPNSSADKNNSPPVKDIHGHRGIDLVFHTKDGLKVHAYGVTGRGRSVNGSDHPFAWTDYSHASSS